MPDLLFELGTEELPHAAVASGEEQLGSAVRRLLAEARVACGDIETFATPRRLAVVVRGLADAQAPAVQERRGPPVAQAYDGDDFAPAATGFARASGVEPAQLVRRETPQGEYLFAVREIPGAPVAEVLPGLLQDAVSALQFDELMRWDASKTRFPRPMRWIVALLGEDVLPMTIGSLKSSRESRGHRLVAPSVDIASPGAYESSLEQAGVIARRLKRRDLVRRLATSGAEALGGRAVVREHVLDEVTDLVERPTSVGGRFDDAFLEVPRAVLETAMEAHQRYFPVQDERGALIAAFVTISNGDPAGSEVIRDGNEKVLRARLEDARFFFREDLKTPLLERTERLGGVVLHPKLGTVRDKVLRVGVLLGRMADWLGLDGPESDAAFAAADVCKADLTTHLVFEFPELQGAVGREYALLDKEFAEMAGATLQEAADAVREHYLPRFPGDELPSGRAGVALGLADRIDTLVGYLGLGLSPSGSEDPYALRRAATGLAAVALGRDARFPLRDAALAAHALYARAGAGLADADAVASEVLALVAGRAAGVLEREGIARLLVEAAAGAQWTDLPDFAARARALGALHDRGKLQALAVAHERCFNLSRGGPWGDVDSATLVDESEQNLLAQLEAVEEIAGERMAARDYAGALETLLPLSEVVAAFFDAVLVMDPDENIKRNRQALLERTAAVFARVADFSGLEPKLLEHGGNDG